MMEVLWANLTHHVGITVFLLILWPLMGAIVTLLWGRLKDGIRFCLCGAFHYSLSTYFGVCVQDSNPTRFKWIKLIHRLVGIIAWAYITAVFITTIT